MQRGWVQVAAIHSAGGGKVGVRWTDRYLVMLVRYDARLAAVCVCWQVADESLRSDCTRPTTQSQASIALLAEC